MTNLFNYVILQGDFTVNDAYTLLPFSNTMVNIEMTGAQIKKVLEDAINFYLDPTGSWGAYPRASGLRFDVNEAMDFGMRVTNLEVNAKLAGEWGAIDMDASYIVVTNNYIATPKDGYFEFGNIDEEKKVDSYVEYAQSFIEYAESVGTLEPVPAERASTQNWSNTLPTFFSLYNDFGCLTGWSSNSQVKVRPCSGYKIQKWYFTDEGRVKSMAHGTCLDKKGNRLVHLPCSEFSGTDLAYNGSDLTFSPVNEPDSVVGVNGKNAKFTARDATDLSQFWMVA